MKTISTFIFTLLGLYSYSQDVRDLVRFSETQVYGSARFEAMAGSFGALGADLSTAAINPAGFGRYSSSTASLAFQNTSILNKAVFSGTETQNSLNSFKLNNLGFVLTNDASEQNKGFLYNQIGFSYNRIQNFKDNFSYSGQQFSSLLDYFCTIGDQISPSDIYSTHPFSTALAWDTYAIDENGSGGYVPRLNYADVIHRRTIESVGGISEYNFTMSTNYMNKLYIGGNLGLRTAKFDETYYHHEIATNSEGLSLDSFQYQYHLKTKGSGTNFKLGIIYLPIENIRLGLSFHTPTFFEFTDNFDADMISYHKDTVHSIPAQYKPYGDYKYRLRTPAKLIGSFAIVLGTHASINADLEVVNYKWAHLKTTTDEAFEPFDYSDINKDARSQLRTVVNMRLGGEVVFNSQYFLRGGIAIYPSAYNQDLNPSKGTQIFSGGLGFKWKNKSIDLALKVEHQNYNYYAFPESLTVVNSFRNGIILNYSVGF
jgi:hypothetical protein